MFALPGMPFLFLGHVQLSLIRKMGGREEVLFPRTGREGQVSPPSSSNTLQALRQLRAGAGGENRAVAHTSAV